MTNATTITQAFWQRFQDRFTSLFLFVLLAATAVTLTACDSNDDDDPSTDLSGSFVAATLNFDIGDNGDAGAINDLNLLADVLSGPPQLEFFSGDGAVTLRYRITDQGDKLISGTFSRNGNVVTVDFSGANRQDDVFTEVIPNVVRYELSSDVETLTANPTVSGVDLARYLEEYEGTGSTYSGRLSLTFTRP